MNPSQGESVQTRSPETPSVPPASEPPTPRKNGNGSSPPAETAKQAQVVADKTIDRIMERTGLPREYVILEAMLHKQIDSLIKDQIMPRLERIELALKTRPVFREVYLTQEAIVAQKDPEGSAAVVPVPSTQSGVASNNPMEEDTLRTSNKKRKANKPQQKRPEKRATAKTPTPAKRIDPPVRGAGDTFPIALLAFLKGKS